MADHNGSAASSAPTSDAKGKSKAVEPQDASMDVDDSSSEDEVVDENEVVEEPDEDNMEEIDTENIIPDGRRTRGRKIDFAKAAEEHPEEDDEDEDDDDFEAAEEDDKMEE